MSALYHQFSAFTISGLTFGAVYALMAFGYTIVYRILRLFNFAHGGVFMIGTFVALWVVQGIAPSKGSGTLLVVGAVAAMVFAAMAAATALSVGLEYGVYRPIRLRRGGGLPALVAGLGMISVMQEVFAKWKGRDPLPVPQPVGGHALATVFGGAIRPVQVLVFAAALLAIFLLDRYIDWTRLGRALRAVGQDPKTASLMGINVEKVVVLSFVMAGATAGLAAALYDLYFGTTSYFAGFSIGLMGLTASLLGGLGSTGGAVAGGLVLGLAESYGGAVFGAEWEDVIAFVALILVLFLRPTGIIGQRMALVRA